MILHADRHVILEAMHDDLLSVLKRDVTYLHSLRCLLVQTGSAVEHGGANKNPSDHTTGDPTFDDPDEGR
eukprot:8758295-Pyramimonas_sp.AAC.1